MNKIAINKTNERITSVDLVEIINTFRQEEKEKDYKVLRHCDFMTKIRKELETLEKLGLKNERNISLVEYVDNKNEKRPCYSLNRDGMLQMLNSESAFVRYKTIEYINKLEEENKKLKEVQEPQLPTTYIEALEQLLASEKEKLRLEEEKKELVKEVTYKEDVIVGLVDDIDLQTKRQRITQIVRHGANGRFQQRYALLYTEFEKKYHLDLKRRMENCDIKPKIKNKMDYIDRVLNKIPELYEIACKLFENDIEELIKEWKEVIE